MYISFPIWNDKFELPDGLYSVSDIQSYFEYIIKKYETLTENSPIRIYVNKIEKRITFKIKSKYYLEFLTPETMKLLRSAEKKITKDKNGKNVLHLEIDTDVALVHCNTVKNDYQQDSRVVYPNKQFGHLSEISPKTFKFLKIFNSKFSSIKVWFTAQNYKPQEIKDKITKTLAIN